MPTDMTNEDLIKIAEAALNPHVVKNGRLFGDVGAALLSEHGQIHTGVSVDTPSWGLCAERAAMAAMITAREYKIRKIVAVSRNAENGKLYILPPCGVCREFMHAVDERNLDADVIVGKNEVVKLKVLLPYHEWPEPM